MAVKLGTSSVTLKLGTQSVTGYLGSAIVTASVPGAPTITTAQWFGDTTIVAVEPPQDDGGLAITEYLFYFNGVLTEPDQVIANYDFFFNYTGQVAEVSAVNAVGEGPRSAPVTVT
jgi:hypothetical protein